MRQRPDTSAGRPSAPTSPTTPAAAMEGGALPPLLRLPPTVRPPQPQPQPPPQPSSPMSPSDSPSSLGPPPQLQPPPQHASTASVASASGPALGGDPSARSSASSVIFGSPTLSDAGGDGISPGGLGPERVLRAGDTLLLLVPDSWATASHCSAASRGTRPLQPRTVAAAVASEAEVAVEVVAMGRPSEA